MEAVEQKQVGEEKPKRRKKEKKKLVIREKEPEKLQITLKAICEERQISKDQVIQNLSEIIKRIVKDEMNLPDEADIVVEIDPDKDSVLVYHKKTVVSEVKDPVNEISVEEAKKIDESLEEGDIIGLPIDLRSFGRRAAWRAKMMLERKISQMIEEEIYREYEKKIGTLISGTVKKIERRRRKPYIWVELGKGVLGLLPPEEQIPRVDTRITERSNIYAVVKDVKRQIERGELKTLIIL